MRILGLLRSRFEAYQSLVIIEHEVCWVTEEFALQQMNVDLKWMNFEKWGGHGMVHHQKCDGTLGLEIRRFEFI